MSSNHDVIQSSRINLVLLNAEALRFSLAGDTYALKHALNIVVPPEWFEATELMKLRLNQMMRQPEFQPWSVRAIIVRESDQMVGHIGFHTRPGAEYLHSIAPDGIEFGYSIFTKFRRLGYAREASMALMAWAYRRHSISQFVVTIDPGNIPSLNLALRLGFNKIGSHVDEVDGVEDIYRLDYRGLVSTPVHKQNLKRRGDKS